MTPLLQLLLDASIRIGIAGLLVGATLSAARIRSSALRHKAWLAVLCAMLLMPVLARLMPRLEIPLPGNAAPVPLAAPAPAGFAIEPPPTATHTATSQPTYPASTPLPATKPGALAKSASSSNALASILLAVYAAGGVLFLSRIFLGWIYARRLIRSSRATSIQGAAVYECAGICSPLTAGLFRPRILFPETWTTWPEEKLRAVLAHELAHVKRRDTAANFLSHLNRCFFWFHPLAWWLERQLAITAEEVCDDAGVAALGASRRYAEVLMDIAQSARRRNQRIALQGVGVDGSGLLTQRVERLLHERPMGPARAWQQGLVAAVCAVAIFAAAACREKTAAALKPDPQYAEAMARTVAARQLNQEVSGMTAADAEALEATVRQNPEDAAARRKLTMFYQTSGRKVLGDEKDTKSLWSLKLWCIEHHPEEPCALAATPLFDPAATQQATKLWEAVLRRKDVTPDQQAAAATFFERDDPRRAEEIVEAGAIPQARRTTILGAIYVRALTGSAAQTPYGQEVRKKLDDSKDAALLARVGVGLGYHNTRDANEMAIGQTYLQRAVALDPNSAAQRNLAELNWMASRSQLAKDMIAAVGEKASDDQYQKTAALPPEHRARFLPYLAESAYRAGDSLDYYEHNKEGARKDWELARRYAKDALAAGAGSSGSLDDGDRLFMANMTLGMVSMRVDGNSREARKYLVAAAGAKTHDQLTDGFILKLPVLLLRYGGADDREAVIEFLERCGKTLHRRDLDLLQAAKELRAGLMPMWYQFQAAQLK